MVLHRLIREDVIVPVGVLSALPIGKGMASAEVGLVMAFGEAASVATIE